jgi:hypothetical protein
VSSVAVVQEIRRAGEQRDREAHPARGGSKTATLSLPVLGPPLLTQGDNMPGSGELIAPPGQEGCLHRRCRQGGGSGSTEEMFRSRTTTPSAPPEDASRHFLNVASAPPDQEGRSAHLSKVCYCPDSGGELFFSRSACPIE